jgi:hypothetical protein
MRLTEAGYRLYGSLVFPRVYALVHFALNCASRSCPPIAFYQAEKI